MSNYRSRYGIPGNEIANLSKRWQRKISKDCEWEDFNSFLFWCSVSGYKKGRELRRNDPESPHGPGNSYWYSLDEKRKREEQERIRQKKLRQSTFCQGCSRVCQNNGSGCKEWEEWFVKNWNRNIHRKPKEPEAPQGKQYFRYEHPDLVREGIVFEHSTEC